jgi:hypothetical protein
MPSDAFTDSDSHRAPSRGVCDHPECPGYSGAEPFCPDHSAVLADFDAYIGSEHFDIMRWQWHRRVREYGVTVVPRSISDPYP